jgi:hypothetical protein
MNFVGAAKPLVDADIAAEALKLGCDAAAIWAVCDIESAGRGFLPDNRPQILFEAHYFHTLTNGIYDRAYPNISAPIWNSSLYGAGGAHQYDRLDVAIGLNQTAGLESASWGRFQIMGANFAACGYPDVMAYVLAMMDDEANHLLAFGAFCNASGIASDLASHDWSHFALRYNGPGQVADYAGKLASAYAARLSGGGSQSGSGTSSTLRSGSTGPAVGILQADLNKLGYTLTVDDSFGPMTATAVKDFQLKHGLVVDGVVGPITMGVISNALSQLP